MAAAVAARRTWTALICEGGGVEERRKRRGAG